MYTKYSKYQSYELNIALLSALYICKMYLIHFYYYMNSLHKLM